MEVKTIVLLLASIAAQALAAPSVLEVPNFNRNDPAAQRYAQYGNVQLAAGTTILRMRSFFVALEMHYTIQNNNAEMFAKMREYGVPEDRVVYLEGEMTTRGNTSLSRVQGVILQTVAMIDLLAAINNDIVRFPERLTTDLLFFNQQASTVDISYTGAWENVDNTRVIMRLLIDKEIAILTPAERQEIEAMMDETEAVINRTGYDADLAKREYDNEVLVARESLEAFIATQPPLVHV